MEERVAKVEQKLDDHIAWSKESSIRNDKVHDSLIDTNQEVLDKLEEALVFQSRLRWVIGVVSTMLGAILMLVYHYLPWIWDALPKHGHTH